MAYDVGERFCPHKMFTGVWIPYALLSYPNISATAKLLYGKLSQMAGKGASCSISQSYLATELGVSVREIRRVLGELVEDKFITVMAPTGANKLQHQPNRYIFIWHPIFNDDATLRYDKRLNVERQVAEDRPVPTREDRPVLSEDTKQLIDFKEENEGF